MRTDDGSIIQDCLNGESEAFGMLVDKYKAGIYAFAYSKLGNFQDAQDITQEVFLEAYSNLRKLRRWDSFSFWIYRMASTLCKKWIQNQMKRPDLKYIDDLDIGSLETPSVNSYRENKLYDSVRDALNSMPETYREVLMLHYFAGMDSKEIATALGLSPTAIRMRISRAREQLREEMIAMMGTAFDEQRLQASFTFRLVEAVKRIKINPVSTMKGLPWGLSLATGLLITFLSINPALISFDHIGTPVYSPLPAESKVLKIGEIPVDVVKTSNISILSSRMGKGNGGEPENMQNAFFMAPKGEGGEWGKKSDMLTARGTFGTCVVNGKLYAIGGETVGAPNLAVVEEYDPVADKWARKKDMPTKRITDNSCVVVDGKIYVIGGLDDKKALLSTVEIYNPKNDTWSKGDDMPTARANPAISTANGRIYVFGGDAAGPVVAAVEEYNPATNIWTKKGDMTVGRAGMPAVNVNGKIYVLGGCVNNWLEEVVYTVEEYDPNTDSWVKKADMPTRGFFGACELNGKIYVMGGLDAVASWTTKVDVYDPVDDSWSTATDMPTARHGLSVAKINGKIYSLGGFTNNFKPCSTVEEYTPEGWEAVSPKGKLPKTWGNIKSK